MASTHSEKQDLPSVDPNAQQTQSRRAWRSFLSSTKPTATKPREDSTASTEADEDAPDRPKKWNLGILNDKETDEVPGSILLMPKVIDHNIPLGISNTPAVKSHSTLPSPYPRGRQPGSENASMTPRRRSLSRISIRSLIKEEKKKTKDGLILEPQPEESKNDPLNWAPWRRDVALFSLGLYCMIGGGMTPVLAAGFTDVAETYGVTVPAVALTTGLYMMGMGLGSVIASPTAILFGKRPVYLGGCVMLIASSIWCALSPSYMSLVVARIFHGMAVSPVECLPSATIAEIFFLHERAYRLGIYTLLLLGGKNLVPLVSAAIIQSLGWRWVFGVVAIFCGFAELMLFFFVPETVWDRTPKPKDRSKHAKKKGPLSAIGHLLTPRSGGSKTPRTPHAAHLVHSHGMDGPSEMQKLAISNITGGNGPSKGTIAQRRILKSQPHVEFKIGLEPKEKAQDSKVDEELKDKVAEPEQPGDVYGANTPTTARLPARPERATTMELGTNKFHRDAWKVTPGGLGPKTPALHSFNSPSYLQESNPMDDYLTYSLDRQTEESKEGSKEDSKEDSHREKAENETMESEKVRPSSPQASEHDPESAVPKKTQNAGIDHYTHRLREAPPQSFAQMLKPWNGRICHDKWLKVAARPFILFAYPAILWSTLVYSLSVGWLIVLSESVAVIYREGDAYHFSALQVGLVYLSPFIGGILGSAVAGKLSDVLVRFLARKNDGIYEPEFRLFMAIPIMIATVIGLMGFGWSAEEKDNWIVPTIFFGIISFGCSLGSTTAITFAVDSYRQYAGEALVTLNFSKNIFHGLVFSLFFNKWLESTGSKHVFVAIGVIQIVCLLTTVPMYIYGKRLRMWTVRRNMMERF